MANVCPEESVVAGRGVSGRCLRCVLDGLLDSMPDAEPIPTPNVKRPAKSSLVDSFEDRDAFVASGMESGIVEGYERLDAILDSNGQS
jgi:hypothetical protein